MSQNCNHPTCQGEICRRPAKEKKKPVAIPKVAKHRLELNKVYAAQARQFLKQHPFCEARLTGCQGAAMDVHHSRGRGKYLLDETTWKALCRVCHTAIENHPEMAKSIGISESRLSNNF